MSTTSDRSHAADAQHSRSFLLLVYANAFITGAVVMGFEMLGSRYLNPFFGSGIYTWAALISTVLAALTAGYFFGGWMADRNPKPSGLGWLIVAGSAYLAFIPLFADGMLDLLSAILGGLADQREFERWGSIAGAMLLLFVPLALLGVYSPYAIRLTLRATARSGTVAGRIYGISTLGSIFGTLFTTFYLIPAMGSRHITYLLSAIGVAAGLSFLAARPGRTAPALAALLIAGAALGVPGAAQAEPPARLELAQASPNAKEAAERLIAYLRKNGAEVRHGAIEDAGRGFRIKDLSVTTRDARQGATLTAAALEAASFEEAAAEGLVLTAAVFTDLALTGNDKGSAKAARLAAERFAWSAAGRIALAGLAARDLEVAPRAGEQVRIATFETALFRLDPAQGGALERLAVRGITSKSSTESGSVGSIEVESIVVDLPRRAAVKGFAVRDIVADTSEGTVRIALMELRAFESVNLLDRNPADLRVFEFAVRGIEAPLDTGKDPAFARDMKELGYTSLKMSAELSYRYDEANKIFDLGKLELDVADMGALALSLRIGGVTPDEIKKAMEPPAPPPGQARPPQNNGAAAMGLLARINLLAADLSYRDKSILARVVKREAQRKQTDEASIRAQYRALLTGLRDEQPDPLVKEVFDAVIAFIDNPGELVVEVRPPAPLNLLAIGALAASNPAQLRSVLGIKITAKKP
ncbi:MAG: fused MFS/spermidine synthase [Candidatus Odyssella sp.]|nr:fused MFS/spermidine synthase [Candidatus Odyssella sp.]